MKSPTNTSLVVGTGRCGTGYVVRLLNELGIPTTHEHRYGLAGLDETVESRVDVSWLAVPFLPFHEGPTVHLVRDPRRVIGSLEGIEFFTDEYHGHYRQFAYDHSYKLHRDHNRMAACQFYVQWNRKIEQWIPGVRRYRVEDLDDPNTVWKMLRHLRQIPTVPVDTAIERVPTNANTWSVRGRPPVELDWTDLALGNMQVYNDLMDMAKRYGYR